MLLLLAQDAAFAGSLSLPHHPKSATGLANAVFGTKYAAHAPHVVLANHLNPMRRRRKFFLPTRSRCTASTCAFKSTLSRSVFLIFPSESQHYFELDFAGLHFPVTYANVVVYNTYTGCSMYISSALCMV